MLYIPPMENKNVFNRIDPTSFIFQAFVNLKAFPFEISKTFFYFGCYSICFILNW